MQTPDPKGQRLYDSMETAKGLVALARQSPPHFGTGHRECLAPRSSPVLLKCTHVKKILLFF